MKVELLSYTKSTALLASLPISEVDEDEFLNHLGFTFAIEGVSRACSHQIVRHRSASFSQQSQRYIQIKRLNEHVVTPPSIHSEANDKYKEFMDSASETYQTFVDSGIPKEDARFVLPNATESSMLMTIDGKSLTHFYGLRLCNRAQWEVRALAEEMLKLTRNAEPDLFSEMGPYCVQLGYCPEGRFSCGKSQEMIDKYKKHDQILKN